MCMFLQSDEKTCNYFPLFYSYNQCNKLIKYKMGLFERVYAIKISVSIRHTL